jgi:hypothetical protein
MTPPNIICKGLPASSRACRLRTLYHYINLPKHILNVLVGPQHPIWMRLAVGLGIMLASSYITEGHIQFVVRDLFHAIGAVPWLEYFIAIGREEQAQQDDQNKN